MIKSIRTNTLILFIQIDSCMRVITIQQKNSFEKTQQNKANPNLSFFYLSEEQRELQTQQ
jgi:hypothetical protein